MATDKESRVGSVLPSESIKVIAESVGVSGLADEASAFLAEDISYRLKLIIQVQELFVSTKEKFQSLHSKTQNIYSVEVLDALIPCSSTKLPHLYSKPFLGDRILMKETQINL